MQGTQAIDNYTSWFSNDYGFGNANEDLDSVFDICYRYPVSDPDSPPEKTVYQHQPRRESEYDFRHWLSEYDSCCGGYWGDDLFSSSYGILDNGCIDIVVKTEDFNHSEDQYQGYTSYCEDEFSHPDDDFNPWYSRPDDYSYSYTKDEPSTMYCYRIDEVGICDGIFGYFPCLLREQQQLNNMQWRNN